MDINRALGLIQQLMRNLVQIQSEFDHLNAVRATADQKLNLTEHLNHCMRVPAATRPKSVTDYMSTCSTLYEELHIMVAPSTHELTPGQCGVEIILLQNCSDDPEATLQALRLQLRAQMCQMEQDAVANFSRYFSFGMTVEPKPVAAISPVDDQPLPPVVTYRYQAPAALSAPVVSSPTFTPAMNQAPQRPRGGRDGLDFLLRNRDRYNLNGASGNPSRVVSYSADSEPPVRNAAAASVVRGASLRRRTQH